MWIWRGMKIYEGRLRHDGNKKKKMSEKNKKSENIWTLVSLEFPVNIFIFININLRANNNNNNTQLSSFHMYPVPWENMYLYSSSIRSNLQLCTPPPPASCIPILLMNPLWALSSYSNSSFLASHFFLLYPYPLFVFEINQWTG